MQFSHHFWGMHYAWWIFWIFVISALLMRGKTSRRESSRETLRRRYAAGEIDEAEYKHQLSVLEQTNDRKPRDRETGSAA